MKYILADKKPTVSPTAYIAPGANIIGDVAIDEYASVWFNAVLRGDTQGIRIGRGSNVQDGTVIHVDSRYPTVIGSDVTIGHSAIVHGCTIADRVIVGMGSIIMDGAVIGEHTIIGSGTVIPAGKTYPPGVLILGSPGKVIRDLTPEEIEKIVISAQIYKDRGIQYRSDLQQIEA
ncbi:gamma carbonic anhydrase family protein [Brevibacillus thermoruber]|jgi:gamma-carbonic anhydrase|uniref:Gamma carbonic anhydrase family protein n=1 Tax=Brevibacillus thermoruber TaxID=33942 RepID=A0A9X3TPN4_9BACL|nr:MULTISPECIES: gamma carbonic anhydrase family protein [Brevibacillus]MDA5108040.1 gamma carbonic anhydrase family protein [Brevibacillus thermoruber]TRY26658.1 gamma carbonic anhydrase family protein [Brevibacillus sp. LEMMJ03]UYZ15338.1 gamma carbonic anhydrase family protein [Brevibacillus sp. WF146]